MTVAFIPVRGGSKSIPLKNIKPMNGRPLAYWAVKAACDCDFIDQVFVATDHDAIRDAVESFGLPKTQVIGRAPETATDVASTESVMLEFAERNVFDHIVLIQATAPLLTAHDLRVGFEIYRRPQTDGVLSVVRQKRFLWDVNQEGFAKPMNYDPFRRPRRQEVQGYFVENGAFYITSRERLLETRCRISGNIRVVEMDESSYFEIDEPSDWYIVERLMQKRGMLAKDVSSKAPIQMVLMDCDGCLTDGGMLYTENGDEAKRFFTRDGFGIERIRESGAIVGIITGESTELVRRRAKKLKMDIVALGVRNKKDKVLELCKEHDVPLECVAYIGDDLNDYAAMQLCGFKACPADAVTEIQALCDYVSPFLGGYGAVRDVCEHLLKREDNYSNTNSKL